MADKIQAPAKLVPASAIAFGDQGEDAQYVTPENPLPVLGAAPGNASLENSTFDLLGPNETYTGDWSTNGDPQVGFSFQADQEGTLFLDFSRNDGLTIQTVKKYEVRAGEVGRFDALVKGAGRSFRLRYVNGSTAQAFFEILAFTGDGLFPFARSTRDDPVGLTSFASADTGDDLYEIMVDLSDTENYPHNDTGSIDLYGSYVFADKASNTVGLLQFGVIVRVDSVSADIAYVQGISFNNSSDRQISRDRNFTNPFRLSVAGGKLTRFLTKAVTNNVTEVNTSSTLGSTAGLDVTPAVGDIIVRYQNTSGGSFNGFVTIQYAGNVSTS